MGSFPDYCREIVDRARGAGWSIAAERAMLARLDGTCHTPIAGLARIERASDSITLRGLVARVDGSQVIAMSEQGGAADAARAHFDRRRYVVERFLEEVDRRTTKLFLNTIKGAVNNLFSSRFLPIDHNIVHKFRQRLVTEFWIRMNNAFICAAASGHLISLLTSDAWRRTSNDAVCGP